MTDLATVQGQPHNYTDVDLDRLATITPAVIADARADARRHDAQLAALLDARKVRGGR